MALFAQCSRVVARSDPLLKYPLARLWQAKSGLAGPPGLPEREEWTWRSPRRRLREGSGEPSPARLKYGLRQTRRTPRGAHRKPRKLDHTHGWNNPYARLCRLGRVEREVESIRLAWREKRESACAAFSDSTRGPIHLIVHALQGRMFVTGARDDARKEKP